MIQTIGTRFALLFAAGGLGAITRYCLSAWLNSSVWCGKPWGILFCNLLGCFLFGLLSVLLTKNFSPEIKLIVLTGFLGAFTTFSTYMFDTVDLLEKAQYSIAIVNVLFHNGLGALALFGGLILGRVLIHA